VVEHVKLLLHNIREEKRTTSANERHARQRAELEAVLKKSPYEIFQDFMDSIITHLVSNKTKSQMSLHGHNVELVLAFPGGWPTRLHSDVSEIGAKAMRKAIEVAQLRDMNFAIEHVYTVSETLTGVKEWLGENIIKNDGAQAPPYLNLDGLEVSYILFFGHFLRRS